MMPKRQRKPEIPRGDPVTAYPERLRLCSGCEIWFAPIRQTAVYCSTRCRVRVHARLAAKPPA